MLIGTASAPALDTRADLRDAIRRAREKAAFVNEAPVDAARDILSVTYPSELMEEIADCYRGLFFFEMSAARKWATNTAETATSMGLSSCSATQICHS